MESNPGEGQGLGVRIAESPAEQISEVPVVFLNLFDSDAVASVLQGERGLLQGNCQDKLIIDTTTNHFDQATRFHDLVRQRGCQYVEATILGSIIPATQGTLTVLVSGDQPAYEIALPYLQKMGRTSST